MRLALNRFSAWMLGLLLLLLIALGSLSIVKQRHLGRIDTQLAEEQRAIEERAYERIEQDLDGMLDQIYRQARLIAQEDDIIEALARFTSSADPASQTQLIRYFANHSVDEGIAVEVYTAGTRIVAWKGFSMPLGDAPFRATFPYRVQFEALSDREVAEALVVWHPVMNGTTVVGAIRVMRQVSARMPVENQFLQSYNLSDTWRRLTDLPVVVRLGAGRTIPDDLLNQGEVHELIDPLGSSIGLVWIPVPSPEELRTTIDNRYTDLQSMLITLALVVVIGMMRQGLPVRRSQLSASPWNRWRGSHILYFLAFSGAWWGLRFVLLYLEVPARWQRGKAPLAPLFDPSHFASSYGWDLFRSVGDMFTTAVFAIFFAFWFFRYIQGTTSSWTSQPKGERSLLAGSSTLSMLWVAVSVGLVTVAIVSLTQILGTVAFRAVLDSTLDYVERSGLIPERLVFFVFCTLMMFAIAVMIVNVALAWFAVHQVRKYSARVTALRWVWVGVLVIIVGVTWWYGSSDASYQAPFMVVFVILLASWGGCVFISEYPEKLAEWVHFRGALLGILLLAVPLYALLDRGMDEQLRVRMMEAASSFDFRQDPRVVFAIEQVLNDARDDAGLADVISGVAGPTPGLSLEEQIEQLLRLSPLSSLITHDVSVAAFDTTDRRIAHYGQGEQIGSEAFIDEAEEDEFQTMRLMFEESGTDSILVDLLTGRYESDQFQYGGIGPVYHPDTSVVVGWIVARAEPKALLRDEGTLFPKVLLPQGVSQLQGNLSLAQFQGDVLVRSLGSDFGQYRMKEIIFDQLKLKEDLWYVERKGDREHMTYYKRSISESPSVTSPSVTSITAVRASQMNLFDHLYYLLRLFVAGICVGGPIYGLTRLWFMKGPFWRTSQLRFKDRVLNAFLAVGIVAVGIVGVFGLRVITAENNNAIQSWIKEHLDRVEEYLTLNAEFGELPSEVLNRIDVNELAERIGLDVNVYEEAVLTRTTRQQLVRDRLIDQRLPVEAYHQLFNEGERHAFTNEKVGEFRYKAGYRVLSDSEGRPRFVISVPTLPEQERIEEERARTVAYLFGALLLLVIAVMLTASLLANALSRPIGRLREGLQAVARGRFERPLPVDTRDEIGQLVHTFNEMQDQLADSRRKLAQQERQLAWREMARQVAHEIKNPLTPMKLSVQHLRRAYANTDPQAGDAAKNKSQRFNELFDRITMTLIEQVDTLARIANEFSSFARMPKRLLEPLDLNSVLKEAVDLMQEQVNSSIEITLHKDPLILEADRKELRRIYINLIKNAIEATSHQEDCRIRVTSNLLIDEKDQSAWGYSTVEDKGTGIAPEMVDRIFEPNFSSKTSGTGLGLAIVRKSVEDLQGEVGFQTKEHEGTTFWIKLPLIVE